MRQNYIIIPRILSNRGYLYSTKTDVCANFASIDEPFVDICDHLEGEYPKDFKFVGWHPLCRCITTNILKTKEERREDRMRIMRGEAPIPPEQSKNYVGDTPDQFKAWCTLNAGRVERAKSVPYFIRDNRGYYATLLALEKQMQAVGRYHVGVNFKNGSGHIITAERLKNGNLIYYDAQNGAFLNIEEYSARKVEYLEVIKVDKLLIRADWFMSIATLP